MFSIPPMFGNGDPNKQMTPNEIQRRRALADALLENGESQQPIQHWMQGVSRVVDAGVGAHMHRKLDGQERSGFQSRANGVMQAFGGPTPPPAPTPRPNPNTSAMPGQLPPGQLPGLSNIGQALRRFF